MTTNPSMTMKTTDAEIYQRIQTFAFDPPGAHLTFADKLAVENGWTAVYTQRVIAEYKRFTFLAVVAGHSISPSDAVDQAWHLHMLYSQPYWEEFCPTVLGRALHHYPSHGGQAEKAKLQERYRQTLACYTSYFGSEPPADIWPPGEIRDTRHERFIRVNLRENWVIRKPGRVRLIDKAVQPTNPVDVTGLTTGHAFAATDRPPFDAKQTLSTLTLYELAYLAGDSQRVALTAAVALLQQGYLRHHAEHGVLLPDQALPAAATTVEKIIIHEFALNGRSTLAILNSKLSHEVTQVRQTLKQKGLLEIPRGWGWWYSLSLLALVLLCVAIPGMTCLALPVALVLSGIRFASLQPRPTEDGKALVTLLRTHEAHDLLREAQPGQDDLVLLTAVDGMAALDKSDLKYLLPLLQPPTTDSSGCGC